MANLEHNAPYITWFMLIIILIALMHLETYMRNLKHSVDELRKIIENR